MSAHIEGKGRQGLKLLHARRDGKARWRRSQTPLLPGGAYGGYTSVSLTTNENRTRQKVRRSSVTDSAVAGAGKELTLGGRETSEWTPRGGERAWLACEGGVESDKQEGDSELSRHRAGPQQQCKKGPSLRTLRKGQLSRQAHARRVSERGRGSRARLSQCNPGSCGGASGGPGVLQCGAVSALSARRRGHAGGQGVEGAQVTRNHALPGLTFCDTLVDLSLSSFIHKRHTETHLGSLMGITLVNKWAL